MTGICLERSSNTLYHRRNYRPLPAIRRPFQSLEHHYSPPLTVGYRAIHSRSRRRRSPQRCRLHRKCIRVVGPLKRKLLIEPAIESDYPQPDCIRRAVGVRLRSSSLFLARDRASHLCSWRTARYFPPGAVSFVCTPAHAIRFKSLYQFGSRSFLTQPEPNPLIFSDLNNGLLRSDSHKTSTPPVLMFETHW